MTVAKSPRKVEEVEENIKWVSIKSTARWQKRFQINEETDELELSDVEQLKAEVCCLKREAEILRQERDILKKTVSIFSQDAK